MKTENGRGRGGGGWSLVKNMIELAKTEVIAVPPEQRERVLERARREAEIWRRGGPQLSEVAALRRAVLEPVPRRRAVSRHLLAGQVPPRGATAAT